MILLALIYFGLAALGLAVIAASSLRGLWSVVLIFVLPVLAFAIWRAAQPPSGWPAASSPPKTAEFLWASVREPDELSHDRGEIDLWLVPPGASRPRAYRAPYTRRLHEQTQAAMRAVKGGVRVAVRKVALRGGARQSQRARFVFYVLPPPQGDTKG